MMADLASPLNQQDDSMADMEVEERPDGVIIRRISGELTLGEISERIIQYNRQDPSD